MFLKKETHWCVGMVHPTFIIPKAILRYEKRDVRQYIGDEMWARIINPARIEQSDKGTVFWMTLHYEIIQP